MRWSVLIDHAARLIALSSSCIMSPAFMGGYSLRASSVANLPSGRRSCAQQRRCTSGIWVSDQCNDHTAFLLGSDELVGLLEDLRSYLAPFTRVRPTKTRVMLGLLVLQPTYRAADRLINKSETTLSDATCPKQVEDILHRDRPASFLFRMVSMVASDTATCA